MLLARRETHTRLSDECSHCSLDTAGDLGSSLSATNALAEIPGGAMEIWVHIVLMLVSHQLWDESKGGT